MNIQSCNFFIFHFQLLLNVLFLSTMFCASLQFSLLLLLFVAVDYSHSSPSNVNLRYERKTSSLTQFPRYGNFNLVLENGDDFLEFEMCCKNGCHQGSFLFCFEAKQRLKDSECGAGTCAYQIAYKSDKSYALLGFIFNTMDTCFKGKITNDEIYVSYSEGNKNVPGCPLALDSENRLKLFIHSIPDGVNVTLNAKKYVPLTTTVSSSINVTELSQKEDEGISDGLKYTLIGIRILLLVLIICGIGCGIYYCRKPKKASKPAPEVPEIKVEKQVERTAVVKTEEPKESETIKSKTEAEDPKPDVPKRKKAKKMKKESKNRHPKKAAPTNIISSADPAPSKEPIIDPSAEQLKPKQSKKVEKSKSKSKSKTKSETVQYSPPFCLLPLPNEFPDHESQPIQRRGYRGGIRDSLQLEVQDSRQQPECYEGLRRKRRK